MFFDAGRKESAAGDWVVMSMEAYEAMPETAQAETGLNSRSEPTSKSDKRKKAP